MDENFLQSSMNDIKQSLQQDNQNADMMQQVNINENSEQSLISQNNVLDNSLQQLPGQMVNNIPMQIAKNKIVEQEKVKQLTFASGAYFNIPAETTAVKLSAAEENEINKSSKSKEKKEKEKKSRLKKKQSYQDKIDEGYINQYKKDCKDNSPKLVVGKKRDLLKSNYLKNKLLSKKAYKDEDNRTVTQEELLRNVVEKNDYSHLEQMDVFLRNSVATDYIKKMSIPEKVTDEASFVDELYNVQGVKGLLNPLLRIGISLCMHTKDFTNLDCAFTSKFTTKDSMEKLDALINAKVMAVTMQTVPNKHVLRTEFAKDTKLSTTEVNEKVNESVKLNQQSQIFMAKTLLAAHMGKMLKYTSKNQRFWKEPVANAFAHCSRVSYVLPGKMRGETKEDIKKTTNAFLGENAGLGAGFKKRTAATHAIKLKSKMGGNKFKELKKKFGWFWGQNGMNVAVGGLSQNGITGAGGNDRTLLNDGSCGHIYMHLEEGDEKTYTGVMVGFESDGPGVVNQTGHKHGLGNTEFASSFGGQRTDEIGDKYGGRVVDLSEVDAEIFQAAMTGLEMKMQKLLTDAANNMDGAQNELNRLTEQLAGVHMNESDFSQLIKDCVGETVAKEKLNKYLSKYQ